MREVWVAARHIILLDGTVGSLVLRAFEGANPQQSASDFCALVQNEVMERLRCSVALPRGAQQLGAVIAELGVQGISHACFPTGLDGSTILVPQVQPPSIVRR